eukprot:Gregarina_sp_Poly_1__1478@NODE_136_length_13140_cov_67_629236_g121_i0_p16_GENE_NODE_136_length_13140_cov_67_629236_g121_i0NODE_136_length_13140_cov_67_629236_g121_i0_p16_ORF_typecomplete_len109_score20_33SVIP/PF15811_5/1_1e06Colicin_E5/PF12106_8/0_042_NODE_136_length_13140_cov_67_629236_g121_i01095311279
MGIFSKLKSKLSPPKGGNVAGYAPDSNASTTVSVSGRSPNRNPVPPEERRRLAAEALDKRIAEQRAKGGLSQQTVDELHRRQNRTNNSSNKAVGPSNIDSDQYREMLT